jgi:chemotaxis protein methyltransferase CheR
MQAGKLTTRQFELFRDLIYRRSGIRMDVSKITLVTNRIRRRLKANHLTDFDDYYRLLTSPGAGEEAQFFLDAVTTNETSFFRTPEHFQWFQGEFLREMVSRIRKGEHSPEIRVWSAACSTGEEPYSLAICLYEHRFQWGKCAPTVVGTDISQSALRAARQGVFTKRSLEGLDPRRLKRHFSPSADGETFEVRPAIRELVAFQRHNLLSPLGLPPFDCVFLRNVMIYFDRESKQAAIGHLIRSLAPGGYLVVGPSEGVFDMLKALVKKTTFLYQKSM